MKTKEMREKESERGNESEREREKERTLLFKWFCSKVLMKVEPVWWVGVGGISSPTSVEHGLNQFQSMHLQT